MADDVYGENSLNMRAIYDILKLVKSGENTDDTRRFNAKKTTRTDNLIAIVVVAIEDDRRVEVKSLPKPLTSLLELSLTSYTKILAW